MDGKSWFEKELEKRTNSALLQKDEEFVKKHRDATNEQLIEYLKRCAKELKKSPSSCEVIGGKYIAGRLGGWGAALKKAGLSPAGIVPAPEKRKIYKEEYRIQLSALRKEKAEKRNSKIQAKIERETKIQEKKEIISLRDAAWAETHKNDTDDQLLEYLRQRADELGYTPYRRDVEGATMIVQRFDEWAIALTLAGLELPKDIKAPNPKKLAQVQKVINSRRAENQ
ncbi:MAG: hypothetical protein IJ017_09375 [Oscillospiraceae bacterium]|nr:hypothetical protein [Oscillospiraceae bacterium]